MALDTATLLANAAVNAVVSSGVITLLGGVLLRRHTERVTAEVKAEFDRRQRGDEWRRQSLAELLGPALMQLDRTKRAFQRWSAHNTYLESQVVYKANLTVRDLLLSKPHLIPDDLRDVAARLVEHYDRWLEEYERVRGGREPGASEPFIFVGPQGYPFPMEADGLFRAAYKRMWSEVYGAGTVAA